MTDSNIGPTNAGDTAPRRLRRLRPPHFPGQAHLTRFVTAASTRPWAVLWVPVPVAWQLAAQSAGVNRLEEGLALVLTLPYLAGLACGLAVFAWMLWHIAIAARRRLSHRMPDPVALPWYGRIAGWFALGSMASLIVAR